MIDQARHWNKRRVGVGTLARAFAVAALGLAGCNASEPDTPSPSLTPFRSVRAVVNCLNSIGFELEVDMWRALLDHMDHQLEALRAPSSSK